MAKTKQKVKMPSGIRNKLMAAVSMLLVSTIMMVSTTYAWFTLSTAPEVKNISTTVAGNGSLEIALMPTSGSFADISKSGNSGTNAGGTAALTLANTSWGNLITLSDGTTPDPYGLGKITLNPASLNSNDLTKPLAVAEYGYDGRINGLKADNIAAKPLGATSNQFDGTGYGVRAIGETNNNAVASTYGYVVDFAVRLNTANADGTPGKLKLQRTAAQRIYSNGSNADTLGGGSYLEFAAQSTTSTADAAPVSSGLIDAQISELMQAIRVTFIQNYGNAAATTPTILGTAKVDTTAIVTDTTTDKTKAPLKLYKTTTSTDAQGGTTSTETEVTDDVLLDTLNKNQAVQISALVWLDGAGIKNADVAAETLQSAIGSLNLQFSTDVELHPSVNTELKGTTTSTP